MKPEHFSKRAETAGIITDASDRPIGRIIFLGDFEAGRPVKASMLRFPLSILPNPAGIVIYIDGHPYKIPAVISPVKVTRNALDIYLNNILLDPA